MHQISLACNQIKNKKITALETLREIQIKAAPISCSKQILQTFCCVRTLFTEPRAGCPCGRRPGLLMKLTAPASHFREAPTSAHSAGCGYSAFPLQTRQVTGSALPKRDSDYFPKHLTSKASMQNVQQTKLTEKPLQVKRPSHNTALLMRNPDNLSFITIPKLFCLKP